MYLYNLRAEPREVGIIDLINVKKIRRTLKCVF